MMQVTRFMFNVALIRIRTRWYNHDTTRHNDI